MCGIELVADRATKARFAPAERVGHRVCLAMRRHGVYIRPLGDVIVIVLPLTVRDDELRRVAAALTAALHEVLGG